MHVRSSGRLGPSTIIQSLFSGQAHHRHHRRLLTTSRLASWTRRSRPSFYTADNRLSASSRSFQSSAAAGATASMDKDKDWSAAQYLKFERERTRPARDLLAQVAVESPARVLDVGCGPGNSTRLLVERWPSARISGLDSSPDMIEKARKRLPEVDFRIGDLTTTTIEGYDLLFANAVYQWLRHDQRMGIFVDMMTKQKPGGVFAFQVPDNFDEPSHVAMREVAAEGDRPWSEALRDQGVRQPFQSPAEIYNQFKPLCSEVDIWHTSYYHILDDHQAIVEWVKGTGLRPFVDPLSPEARQAFLDAYLDRIRRLYPPLHDGKVCLRYPRLFVVAVRA